MDKDETRRLMQELERRVELVDAGSRELAFDEPDQAALVAAGFEAEPVRRMLGSAWWPEMIAEVLETPEFCGAGEDAEQILGYARDVVTEYIRKRFDP